MTDADVLDIARDMIFTIIKCSAPLLLVSLIVGLVISIFQTVTSIQEQTLTFVPKLLAIFLEHGSWIIVWNFSQGYATILVPMLEGKHVIYNSEHGVLFACFNADIRLCVYGTIF